jgi:hypothetical protein
MVKRLHWPTNLCHASGTFMSTRMRLVIAKRVVVAVRGVERKKWNSPMFSAFT